MKCSSCKYHVEPWSETSGGWGTKFVIKNEQMICEHCHTRSLKSMESLEKLKEKKLQEKNQHMSGETMPLKRKRGRPRKYAIAEIPSS